MRKLLIASTMSLLLLPACNRNKAHGTMPTPTPDSGMRVEGSTRPLHAEETPAPEEKPTPLALDEAGVKKWIAFRREMITLVSGIQVKMKAANEQKTDA